jgi:hypothetical protein
VYQRKNEERNEVAFTRASFREERELIAVPRWFSWTTLLRRKPSGCLLTVCSLPERLGRSTWSAPS